MAKFDLLHLHSEEAGDTSVATFSMEWSDGGLFMPFPTLISPFSPFSTL